MELVFVREEGETWLKLVRDVSRGFSALGGVEIVFAQEKVSAEKTILQETQILLMVSVSVSESGFRTGFQ